MNYQISILWLSATKVETYCKKNTIHLEQPDLKNYMGVSLVAESIFSEKKC